MAEDVEPHEDRFAAREFLRREVIRRNEEVARAVNDATLAQARRRPTAWPPEFACECGDGACMERLDLDVGEFAEIRRHADHFAVKPGHELLQVERVVRRLPAYLVVQKVAA